MAVHHASPREIIDLNPLGEKLKETKTQALVKAPSFETVRLIVLAGKEIPPHDVPGNITLHCLEGRVLLGFNHSAIELSAGNWVYLDGGERHSIKGVEDSSLLFTILFNR